MIISCLFVFDNIYCLCAHVICPFNKGTLKIQELIPSVNVTICFDYTNDRLPTHTSELCQKLIIMLL